MSGLILTLTENFDAEAIRAELSEHLRVDHPKFVYLRTADPPSILHLLGDVLSWLPLKKAAEFLLSELAKRDGNTTWDRLASLLKINAVKPLADVTETLEKAATSVDRKVTMHVGIDIPMIISARRYLSSQLLLLEKWPVYWLPSSSMQNRSRRPCKQRSKPGTRHSVERVLSCATMRVC